MIGAGEKGEGGRGRGRGEAVLGANGLGASGKGELGIVPVTLSSFTGFIVTSSCTANSTACFALSLLGRSSVFPSRFPHSTFRILASAARRKYDFWLWCLFAGMGASAKDIDQWGW